MTTDIPQQAGPAGPHVDLQGVEHRFGDVLVLRGVDLQVAPGEHVVLVGANGAGKTTLLRIVAGLAVPSAGSVRVLGSDPSHPAVKAKVGVLGHRPSLYGHLSGVENLRFWGRLHGVPDAGRRGAGLLAELGLDPDDGRPVSTWSQGMRQRGGIARALLHDPQILLLDEPFAALDEEGEEAVGRLISQTHRTVLLVTHQPARAPLAVSRLLRLSGGRLQAAQLRG